MSALPLEYLESSGAAGPDPCFWRRLETLQEKYQLLWDRTAEAWPVLGDRTSRLTRYANYRHCRQIVDLLADEMQMIPETGPERSGWRRRIERQIHDFGEQRFGWPEGYRNLLVSEEFCDSTTRFARWATDFDREISGPDMAQALRNVWIANSLQMLLDREVSLTPAVFAYSMLYPYTDNFLDDPCISPDRKRSLNKNLAHWLAGRNEASADPHQEQVRRLVGMIEAQFDRRQFPSVFSSLQAIHAGQEGSLIQHDPDAHLTESDLIAIGIRKGGASVLADGYLVCGCLDIPEEDFCMGYGAFLQFLDDLQDVKSDLKAGHQTLFTQAVKAGGPLDRVTSRLYHFMHLVVEGSERVRGRRYATQRDLILRNCVFLLVGAVAENARFFSRHFRRGVERRWPLTLSAMKRLHQRAEGRFRRASVAVCRSREVESPMDLLREEAGRRE
jgi:hypothetical protein